MSVGTNSTYRVGLAQSKMSVKECWVATDNSTKLMTIAWPAVMSSFLMILSILSLSFSTDYVLSTYVRVSRLPGRLKKRQMLSSSNSPVQCHFELQHGQVDSTL